MAFTVSSLRRVATTTTLTTAFIITPLFNVVAQATTLNGAGASFPKLLYQKYSQEYKKKTGNQVNYQAVGSGSGIRRTIKGAVDFGGSDAAMTDSQMKKGKAGERGIFLIPTAGGAVVPIFNVPGVNDLKLSRASLAGVFSGRITKWNDPKIQQDNPGVSLPNAKVRPVVRADGSGTTFIFTNHLSAVDPYFKGRVGISKKPKWSNDPLKSPKNAGVAATVQRTKNSIGYVEYSYARTNGLKVASVQSGTGEFVQPSLQSINDAFNSIQFPQNFRVFEGNPSKGYPIIGATWMMVYRQYPDAEKAKSVKDWMKWVLTDGQDLNNSLDFARIGPDVVRRALANVESIK
ncbi:phosphate ABC transporter substrate-binding protein PstS [filamentous cyanobacterium LEGE 11480]|uniref:Phosphate-binding protein n=1 Tax=Romeriopsis navalis LEGE 11480 TaxID=2777977 RepID=A0A928Z760_9CYAN|nr:phosphate ABC transporter substrate-binding protein PstS [Romeriopsis navalis]MBE9033363.1 phosphate ABC transporter substrate-binding protein PstS [Romeriopsis navalis LEGE 11480]